jgi:hypothetical protein
LIDKEKRDEVRRRVDEFCDKTEYAGGQSDDEKVGEQMCLKCMAIISTDEILEHERKIHSSTKKSAAHALVSRSREQALQVWPTLVADAFATVFFSFFCHIHALRGEQVPSPCSLLW